MNITVPHIIYSLILDTFDVQGVSVTVFPNGTVCFSVQYVEGHEAPAQCYVKLTSNITQLNVTGVFGTSGCLKNVPSGSYNLSVTDADAVATIDTQPAVTQGGIVVPVRPTTGPKSSPGTTFIHRVTYPSITASLLTGVDMATMSSETNSLILYN